MFAYTEDTEKIRKALYEIESVAYDPYSHFRNHNNANSIALRWIADKIRSLRDDTDT